MSDERTATASTEREEERPAAVISAQSATRLVLVLLTIWTAFSGIALIFFQEGSAATIGGGLEGVERVAAQRLLGVHLLALAPVYGLIAWDPRRYRLLLWLPYVAQAGVVAVTAYDIMARDRDFQDGALPLIVAATFLVLLVYVWRAARPPRSVEPPEAVEEQGETGEAQASEPAEREPI